MLALHFDVAAQEAEALRDTVAREVAHSAADFHALHPHFSECEVAERPHGSRHDPLALLLFAQPVADLDTALAAVGRFEPDQPGKGAAVAEREDRVGGVGKHAGHYLPGLFDLVRVGYKRKPAPQMEALRVDRSEDIRGVFRAKSPEAVRAEKGYRFHNA